MSEAEAVATNPVGGGMPRQRSLLHTLFGIPPEEARFAKRGFPASPAQPVLEAAGGTFVDGYNLALTASMDAIEAGLAAHPAHLRGFFAEGAAMGIAIASLMPPWHNRLPALLDQLGDRYPHLMHVGVGWAVARVPFVRSRFLRPLDTLLAPLALDGRGFHDGYFHAARVAAGWRAVRGAASAVYDQGVGRSLWFSCGADTHRIAATIAALPADRADDLWAGVGLAATYAGGVPLEALDDLAPGAPRRWLKQGAAFAVTAHARAGTPPAASVTAAERITGLAWPVIVALVAEAEAVARAAKLPALDQYRLWRSRIADFIEERSL
ncbi:DUF1702 family protein [Sphingomonas sp. MMS12-HWE2-04]|uniref:DUF1702 family protein n=1 Tax=Sphingomonas sp. MMS12-HWE2-04 TaxID=3234199 RepID=UPI00384E7B43